MAMKYGWRVIVRYDAELDGLRMWIINNRPDGGREIVQPINLTIVSEYKAGDCFPEPTLRFSNQGEGEQFLQSLAEGLVQNGFKPDELKAMDKELEAMRYHLEDMRTLTMKNAFPPTQVNNGA